MIELNGEYRTTDTPLAAFLVQEGFSLLLIEYEESPNRRRRATYVFDATSPLFRGRISLYNRGEATTNIALYEHAKKSLLDRIMRGLP